MGVLSWHSVMLGNTLLINEELFFKIFERNDIGIVTCKNILQRPVSDLLGLFPVNVDLRISYV